MQRKMRVITFYSYKGGTGRTLLAANIAVLASRLGMRVVAVDLDLEAPGLSYKLFDRPPISEGVLGWMESYESKGRSRIHNLLHEVPLASPFVEGGSLQLLPAGPPPSLGYLRSMQNLQRDSSLNEHRAVDALLALRDAIEDEYDPELLLIDARTGITTTNMITNRVLADEVVALTLNTPEQLEGTKIVLQSLAPLERLNEPSPIGLNVVVSRIKGRRAVAGSYEWNKAEIEIIDRVSRFFREPTYPISSTLSDFKMSLLHNDSAVANNEFLTMSGNDSVNSTALHIDYLNIARGLLGETYDSLIDTAVNIPRNSKKRAQVALFFAKDEKLIEYPTNSLEIDQPNNFREETSLPERVSHLRRIASENRIYLPNLAESLTTLQFSFIKLGNYTEAVRVADEAVQIYRNLVSTHPEKYRYDLARSINRLGMTYWRLKKPELSLPKISESVEIFRIICSVNPQENLHELADILENLAITYSLLSRTEESAKSYQEALSIYDELGQSERDRFKPDIARSLTGFANQLLKKNDNEQALLHLATSVSIYRGLAADGDEEFSNFAGALKSLSALQSQTGDDIGAIVSLVECSDLYRKLSMKDPAQYDAELARVLNRIGIKMWGADRYEESTAYIEESISIYRDLAVTNSTVYTPKLAQSLANLSISLTQTGRNWESIKAKEEVVSLYREITHRNQKVEDPSKRTKDLKRLAEALKSLGMSYWSPKKYDESIQTFKESLTIFRNLNAHNRKEYSADIADTLENLAITLDVQERHSDAEAAIFESVQIYRMLSDESAEEYTAKLAGTLLTQSSIFESLRDLHSAVASAQESVSLLRSGNAEEYVGQLSSAEKLLEELYIDLTKRIEDVD